MQNYYEFLGIPNFSDIDIVRTAYRNLSKQYHPDNLVNATEEQKQKSSEFQQSLNSIYTYLSNKNNKGIYDIQLKKSLMEQQSFQGNINYSSESDELTNLKNQRFSLRMAVAKREIEILKNAYNIDYYKHLLRKEKSINQEISKYKLEKIKTDKYLKALDKVLQHCNEYFLNVGYSLRVDKQFRSTTSEIKKFQSYSKQLSNEIKKLITDLDKLKKQISEFPSKEYISRDSEIQRLNKLISEIDEKINLYEDALHKER